MYHAESSREADIAINASNGDYDGVRIDMDDNTGTGTAFISGEFTPAQARATAHALLRAADEAEGVNHFDALETLIAKITRERTAAFIRANIDMQGRDFPDAESVAVWLEESA